MDTYNYDSTKIKTTQVKSQEDISFPTDGHKTISGSGVFKTFTVNVPFQASIGRGKKYFLKRFQVKRNVFMQ